MCSRIAPATSALYRTSYLQLYPLSCYNSPTYKKILSLVDGFHFYFHREEYNPLPMQCSLVPSRLLFSHSVHCILCILHGDCLNWRWPVQAPHIPPAKSHDHFWFRTLLRRICPGSRPCIPFRNMLRLNCEELFRSSPNPQAGVSPLVGCTRMLTINIRS